MSPFVACIQYCVAAPECAIDLALRLPWLLNALSARSIGCLVSHHSQRRFPSFISPPFRFGCPRFFFSFQFGFAWPQGFTHGLLELGHYGTLPLNSDIS